MWGLGKELARHAPLICPASATPTAARVSGIDAVPPVDTPTAQKYWIA